MVDIRRELVEQIITEDRIVRDELGVLLHLGLMPSPHPHALPAPDAELVGLSA